MAEFDKEQKLLSEDVERFQAGFSQTATQLAQTPDAKGLLKNNLENFNASLA